MAQDGVMPTEEETNGGLKISDEDIHELKQRIKKYQQRQISEVESQKLHAWWDQTFGDKPVKLLYRLKTRELDVFILYVLQDKDSDAITDLGEFNFTFGQVMILFERAKKTLICESGCSNILDLFRLSRFTILEKIHR